MKPQTVFALRRWTAALVLTCASLLAGCGSEEKTPIKVGFLAGITGRVADLGIAGRNGAQMAVEDVNAKGGINGRQVELLVRDDSQNPEKARQSFNDLAEAGVEFIVGPMTSMVALEIVPLANARRLLLISPTVTTTQLTGKDDYFVRAIGTTADYGRVNARFVYKNKSARTIHAIYDEGNSSYTLSWLNDFKAEFERLGGAVPVQLPFRSPPAQGFSPIVEQLLAKPADAVLILANSVDAALIAELVHRKSKAKTPIIISEWGSTERLLELAGEAVEGAVSAQFFDRESNSPVYKDFRSRMLSRFGQEPGFGGVAAYDAMKIGLEALALRPKGKDLKNVLLEKRTFEGIQTTLVFDNNGEVSRPTFPTRIQNNQFRRIPWSETP